MQYSPAHRGASRHPGVGRGDGTYFPVGPSSRLFYFGAAIIGRASSHGGRSRAHPLIASTAHAPFNATAERCSHARINRRDPPAIKLWELRDPHSAANVRGFWQPSTPTRPSFVSLPAESRCNRNRPSRRRSMRAYCTVVARAGAGGSSIALTPMSLSNRGEAEVGNWPGAVDVWIILLAGNRTPSEVWRLELERRLERLVVAVLGPIVHGPCPHLAMNGLRKLRRSPTQSLCRADEASIVQRTALPAPKGETGC